MFSTAFLLNVKLVKGSKEELTTPSGYLLEYVYIFFAQ